MSWRQIISLLFFLFENFCKATLFLTVVIGFFALLIGALIDILGSDDVDMAIFVSMVLVFISGVFVYLDKRR
jgi:hypothetical protein